MFARIEDLRELESYPDADLVRLLKLGLDEALDVLLKRYSDALYRYCCHLMQNREDAEDVCQETMARAMTKVDTLNTGSAFRSWLFSIARNLSVDSYRTKKRTCAMPDDDALPFPLYDETPQERIEVREEHQTVAEALGKLAQSHQTVLMLREVNGLSYASIAEEMNVSQSAVETLLFRARRRLREEYAKTAVPMVAIMDVLRDIALRFGAPLSGGSGVAKIAVTGAIVGSTLIAAPHTAPRQVAASRAVHPASIPPAVHVRSATVQTAPPRAAAFWSPAVSVRAGGQRVGVHATVASSPASYRASYSPLRSAPRSASIGAFPQTAAVPATKQVNAPPASPPAPPASFTLAARPAPAARPRAVVASRQVPVASTASVIAGPGAQAASQSTSSASSAPGQFSARRQVTAGGAAPNPSRNAAVIGGSGAQAPSRAAAPPAQVPGQMAQRRTTNQPAQQVPASQSTSAAPSTQAIGATDQMQIAAPTPTSSATTSSATAGNGQSTQGQFGGR